MDDRNDVGSPDRDRIAMGEEHEVGYWTEMLGVTKGGFSRRSTK